MSYRKQNIKAYNSHINPKKDIVLVSVRVHNSIYIYAQHNSINNNNFY